MQIAPSPFLSDITINYRERQHWKGSPSFVNWASFVWPYWTLKTSGSYRNSTKRTTAKFPAAIDVTKNTSQEPISYTRKCCVSVYIVSGWLSFSTKESIKLLAVIVRRHFHSSVPPTSSSRLVSRWSTDDLVCQSNEDAPTRMPHDSRLSIVNCYLSSRRFNSSFCVSFSFVSQMSSLPFSCVYICPSVEPSRINESSGTHTIEPSSSPDRYVFYSIEPHAAIVLFVRQSLYDSVWVRRLLFGKMPLAIAKAIFPICINIWTRWRLPRRVVSCLSSQNFYKKEHKKRHFSFFFFCLS